jgi:electron transport complex protein RnfC
MLNKLKRAALGAHTPHDKATAASKPVPMPLPAQVRILMSQHIGAPAKALVKKGDEVFVGTKIGEAGGFVSANIHSVCPMAGCATLWSSRPMASRP